MNRYRYRQGLKLENRLKYVSVRIGLSLECLLLEIILSVLSQIMQQLMSNKKFDQIVHFSQFYLRPLPIWWISVKPLKLIFDRKTTKQDWIAFMLNHLKKNPFMAKMTVFSSSYEISSTTFKPPPQSVCFIFVDTQIWLLCVGRYPNLIFIYFLGDTLILLL